MLGIDIVEVERVKRIYQRHRLAFLEKILNTHEIKELFKHRDIDFFKRISCYLACKEAVFKACREGSLDWQDISIRNISGRPLVRINRPKFSKKISLSFAINGGVVISQAIIFDKKAPNKLSNYNVVCRFTCAAKGSGNSRRRL